MLRLGPAEVRALTPAEVVDLITARVWVERQRAAASAGPRPPMSPEARAAELAKLDAVLARKGLLPSGESRDGEPR